MSRGLIKHIVLPLDITTNDEENIHKKPFEKQTNEFNKEIEYELRYYQKEAVQAVIDHDDEEDCLNTKTLLRLTTGAGKTLIAANVIKELNHDWIICVAPLLCSVEQLQQRIQPFIPDHTELLIDTYGCTDIPTLRKTLSKDKKWVIYTTFMSFATIINQLVITDDDDVADNNDRCIDMEKTYLVIDEIHNAVHNNVMAKLANEFEHSLYLSATVPDEYSYLSFVYSSFYWQEINKNQGFPFAKISFANKQLANFDLIHPRQLVG